MGLGKKEINSILNGLSPLSAGEFIRHTNEDELFAVVSFVLERMKEERTKTELSRISSFDKPQIRELFYTYKVVASDDELMRNVRQTLQEWRE